MGRLILWLVLLFIIGRMVWRFFYGLFEGAGMLKDSPDRAAVKLVRDPVCGVFIVPSEALTLRSGSTTQYFCSEKCRQEWSRR